MASPAEERLDLCQLLVAGDGAGTQGGCGAEGAAVKGMHAAAVAQAGF